MKLRESLSVTIGPNSDSIWHLSIEKNSNILDHIIAFSRKKNSASNETIFNELLSNIYGLSDEKSRILRDTESASDVSYYPISF